MILRNQVILHTVDALPANWVTNNWCLETDGAPVAASFDAYTAAFKAFYDSLGFMKCLPVAGTGHEMKYYDLENPAPPNYPVATRVWAYTSAPSAASLPSEVALCVSFQAPKISGLSQARRRGRIYLGPCATGENVAGRPAATLRNQVAASMVTLVNALEAVTVAAALSIWSQADGTAVAVQDGWIDDTWDTQRRRGVQTTARTVFTP